MNGDSYRLNQSKRRSRRNNADTPKDEPDAHQTSPNSRAFSSASLMHLCSGKQCNLAPALTAAQPQEIEQPPVCLLERYILDGASLKIEALASELVDAGRRGRVKTIASVGGAGSADATRLHAVTNEILGH
jgi:hypothetical protein